MRDKKPRRAKVLGPYHEKLQTMERWTVYLVSEHGVRSQPQRFPSREEAERFAAAARALVPESLSMIRALELYAAALVEKGNRPRSVDTTLGRLRAWFGDQRDVAALTPAVLENLSCRRAEKVATETHRSELAEVRTFCAWGVAQRYWRRSPAEGLKAQATRKKGKFQLHREEAWKLTDAAKAFYASGQRGYEGGLGVLLALWAGLRAEEICGLETRDIDPGPEQNTLIWVAERGGKTPAARRCLIAPTEIEGLLLCQAEAARRQGRRSLFSSTSEEGHPSKTWLRKATRRLCLAAGVPYVPPHGLRGTCASLILESGGSVEAAARRLGHEKTRVTKDHYLRRGVSAEADQMRRLQVLRGGRR